MDRVDALKLIIRPSLRILPPNMRSIEAEAMLLAIGGQESGWRHREQIRGPARGWWQFERNGVIGVQNHRFTKEPAEKLTKRLNYKPGEVHDAIKHNDMLATCFARLLLWTVPESLPKQTEIDKAWEQYKWAWRPGKPHPERWEENWKAAWSTIFS